MFFSKSLKEVDRDIALATANELKRQKENLQLIASENFASLAVMQAQGSVFTNKYAEGYAEKRYYSGCQHCDEVEKLAISRVCKLFNCQYANVQPHSGSQANQAVFLALLKPGDTILGFDLSAGGHLTHGSRVNLSGKWFDAVHYGVSKNNMQIDMQEVADLAIKHKPKIIIAGASAYSQEIDFSAFRQIADKVGAYLLGDIAHYSGLIAGGAHPSPFPHVDIATSTTHKTLRGPRGAIILTNKEELIKKINSAIFPGLQGGPMMHTIAARAVAFKEALEPEFKNYIGRVVQNAQALSDILIQRGFEAISGRTKTHIVMLDLRSKNLKGNKSAKKLEEAGIICNKNSVPFDTESPFVTSGLRFGSAAETTRGLDTTQFEQIGNLIADILEEKRDTEEAKKMVKQLVSGCDFYSDSNLF